MSGHIFFNLNYYGFDDASSHDYSDSASAYHSYAPVLFFYYSCKLCDFKAQKSKILKAHMKEKHRKEIKCKVCHQLFD